MLLHRCAILLLSISSASQIQNSDRAPPGRFRAFGAQYTLIGLEFDHQNFVGLAVPCDSVMQTFFDFEAAEAKARDLLERARQ